MGARFWSKENDLERISLVYNWYRNRSLNNQNSNNESDESYTKPIPKRPSRTSLLRRQIDEISRTSQAGARFLKIRSSKFSGRCARERNFDRFERRKIDEIWRTSRAGAQFLKLNHQFFQDAPRGSAIMSDLNAIEMFIQTLIF